MPMNFRFSQKILLKLTWLALALALSVSGDVVEDSVLEPVMVGSTEDATPTPEDDDVMIPGIRVNSPATARSASPIVSLNLVSARTEIANASLSAFPVRRPPLLTFRSSASARPILRI